jgi:predicted DNA-binding ribbon-helix-helix protein
VLLVHGEVRNFSSILRCTCLVWLQRRAPLAVAAE